MINSTQKKDTVPREYSTHFVSSLEKSQPLRFLIFDLDNTLYPASSNLASVMEARMLDFVCRYLKLEPAAASAERAQGFHKHGTTLRWLQKEKNLADADEFLRYVHPENLIDCLKPDPELPEFLASLPLPKVILTNSPFYHAERVLTYLNIREYFIEIFDLSFNQYEGKPHLSAYERCLKYLGVEAKEALFIDDMPSYLASFQTLGGSCVLIDESDKHANSAFPRLKSLKELKNYLFFDKELQQ